MREPFWNIFDNPNLTREFFEAAGGNRDRLRRRIIEGEIDDSVRDQYHPTNELMKAFMNRFDFFMQGLEKGDFDLIDFFGERTIWDIHELFLANVMDQPLPTSAQLHFARIAAKIEMALPEDPSSYLSSIKNNFGPVEDEETLDKILLGMLHHKITHNGKIPMSYCYFVLRQCFFENSAVMQNRNKYEEVVFRFLEDYTKGISIKEPHKSERRIIRELKEELKNEETNPARTNRCINRICQNLRDLIRIGWVFSSSTVEYFAKLIEKNEMSSDDRALLFDLLGQACCLDGYDNSPVVVIRDLSSLGKTKGTAISLDEDHICNLFEGDFAEKLDVINTIIHENAHVMQFRDFDTPQNYFRYLQLKYHILVKCGEIDYDENYAVNDLLEDEAFALGARGALNFATKNKLAIQTNLTDIKKDISRNEAILLSQLAKSCPIETYDGELPLVDFFDEFLELRMQDVKDGVAVSGGDLFEDYPILYLEYGEDGKKRSFEDFIQNARRLIVDGKFFGSLDDARFNVDKNMIRLIKDIARFEYGEVEMIPEIVFCLSRESNQFDNGENPLYQYFIRDLTHEMLGDLFSEALVDIDYLPNREIDKIAKTVASVEQLVHEPNRAYRQRINEFLSGIRMPINEELETISPFRFIPRKFGKSSLELMEEFEQRAKEITGVDYIAIQESRIAKNKERAKREEER